MDLYIGFWHSGLNEVYTTYVTATFLGYGIANDILKAFYDSVKELNLYEVFPVSMDCPAVNWTIYDLLQEDLEVKFGCQVLNVGSCGLHTLNNASKNDDAAT